MNRLVEIAAMLTKEHGQATPLLVWLYVCLILSLVLYALDMTADALVPPSTAFSKFNSKKLLELSDSNVGTVKVVMLGDSRLRYAVAAPDQFAENLSKELDKSVKVVRIVNNWAVFQDFDGVVDSILEVEPDLIVLQDVLLSKKRTRYARLMLVREYLYWRIFGNDHWNPGGINQQLLQSESGCSALDLNETVQERKRRVSKWYTFDRENKNKKNIEKFIRAGNDKRISFAFISIPVTEKATDNLPTPLIDAKTQVIKYSRQLPDSMFCEHVHMNEAGRSIYTEWLAKKLSRII